MRDSGTKRLNTVPSTAGTIARLAYEYAAKKGADVHLLLRTAGLSLAQIDDSNARLDVRRQIKFLNLVSEALGDNLLGFHLSQNFDLRRMGLLYYVMSSSDTLGEAIRYAARYGSIVNEGIRLTHREGNRIGLIFEYVGVSRHLDRHQIEFFITALLRGCRQLTNRQLTADKVSFVHLRTEASEMRSFYRCELEFGADADKMEFLPSIRHIPIVSADPYLNNILIKYCEEALAHRVPNRSSLEASACNAIAVLLPHGKAQMGEVARKLAMSQRTLARRLASEGLTFAGVLDSLRCDLARRHLADRHLSISQIAWLLGYKDVSAFSHAHKRWTGKTPRATQRHLRAKRAPAHARALSH
jgi:AraC-like DNA-binding protein